MLCLLLVSTTLPTYAIVGLTDWQNTTPGGNKINNFTKMGNALVIVEGADLEGIDDWYFYKDYVIGHLISKYQKDSTMAFFAVNESSKKINTFSSEASWNAFLTEQQLQPKIWTRWYNTDWTFLDDVLMFLTLGIFMTPFFVIPLLFLWAFILYKAIIKERLNRRMPFTIALFLITCMFVLVKLLDYFPQSI